MEETIAYLIPVCKANLKIHPFDNQALKNEMEKRGVTDPEKMSNYDDFLFTDLEKAFIFYDRFFSAKKKLRKTRKKEFPCMLCKRHYLVLALMEEKLVTTRSYKKDWKKGQIFYLYDQTYYVKVELTSLIEEDGHYAYNYKLID